MGDGPYSWHHGDPRGPLYREHKPKSKKDTKTWCKGKVGRPHKLETTWRGGSYQRKCAPPPDWWPRLRRNRNKPLPNWSCSHQLSCSVCGKIIVWPLPWTSCPDLPKAFHAERDAALAELLSETS